MKITPDFTVNGTLTDYGKEPSRFIPYPPVQATLSSTFLRHHALREIQRIEIKFDYLQEIQVNKKYSLK